MFVGRDLVLDCYPEHRKRFLQVSQKPEPIVTVKALTIYSPDLSSMRDSLFNCCDETDQLEWV
jgi:hypothetical protein